MTDRHPTEPPGRHVWVHDHGRYGLPQPGVVVSWQHAPVHNATASEWIALVVTTPADEVVLVSWVGAERLEFVDDTSTR